MKNTFSGQNEPIFRQYTMSSKHGYYHKESLIQTLKKRPKESPSPHLYQDIVDMVLNYSLEKIFAASNTFVAAMVVKYITCIAQ